MGTRSLGSIARSGPARNSAGSFLIQGSQRFARIATIVVAAAVLDPLPFAALAVALALTDLVRSALLAYDVSAVRLLSSGEPAGRVLGSHGATKLVVGLVGTIAVLGFSLAAYGSVTTTLVVITSLGTIPVGISSLLLARRQAEFALSSVAGRVALASALGAVLTIAGLLATGDAMVAAAGLAAGDLLVLLLLAGGLGDAVRPGLRPVEQVIRRSTTLLVMQLAYIGQFRIGTVILAACGSAVAVGEYTVASRVAEGLVILAAALTASSFPMMGGAHARGDMATLERTIRRSYRLSLVLAAPIVAILALSAPLWVAVLFPRYPGAAAAYIPVGITVIVYFASSQTSAFLNASHRDRVASSSATAGLIASALGSWWLVGLGAVGVAAARLCGDILRLAIETMAMARTARVLTSSMPRTWLGIAPFVVVAVIQPLSGWSPPALAIGMVVTIAWAGWLITRGWLAVRR
jgi:O-antigen/teichoic acid export membrane protein